MDMKKDEKKLQIERYLECRGEVRELERLLQESRMRYRKRAKNIKRQTWGDYFREWKEWWVDKDAWISNAIKENEKEMSMFQNLSKSIRRDGEDEMYNSYNTYINSQTAYDDYETDEI